MVAIYDYKQKIRFGGDSTTTFGRDLGEVEVATTFSQHFYNEESTSGRFHMHYQGEFHDDQPHDEGVQNFGLWLDTTPVHKHLDERLREMGVSKSLGYFAWVDGCRIHCTNKHYEIG